MQKNESTYRQFVLAMNEKTDEERELAFEQTQMPEAFSTLRIEALDEVFQEDEIILSVSSSPLAFNSH